MKHLWKNKFLFSLLMLISFQILAEVTPPNYNFSLDKLNLFMPGKSFKALETEYPNKEVVFNEGGFKTYKFYVSQLRYKFPVFVQVKNDEITDFHARLPGYFLHDVFHQSLINRLGNQDIYKKQEDQAYYLWKNKNGFRHTYYGACSITCFPIHYSVQKAKHEYGGSYQSVFEKMNKD